MKASQLYLMLIIKLMKLFIGEGNIYWMSYWKEEIHADCFFIDLHYFCHQINQISHHKTLCTHGKLWSFEKLKAYKITTENLIDWAIPFDLIGQYADYSNNDGNTTLAGLMICNCTTNWKGRECDYSVPQRFANPGNLLSKQYKATGQNMNETLTKFIDGIVCTNAHLFLEWRHICDGVTQCSNGADEYQCDLLEFHECEKDEFQCRNGMCVSIDFVFDAMPDCMDSSDEQSTEEMRTSYYSCSGKASVNCDNRLCRKDEFSCGNGECIPWTSIVQDNKGCSNRRQAAYICDTMDYKKELSDELFGICSETMRKLSLLTNTSSCLQSLGHLLRNRFDIKLRQQAFANIKERCEQLIIYSDKNAYFPGLHVVYNRSDIEAFYDQPKNLQKRISRAPQLYYFSGEIKCNGVQINISDKFWFTYEQRQQFTIYPFFPLYHLLCQKFGNQFLQDSHVNSSLPSSPAYYQCKNTSDRLSLRRVNDGFIDCLHGDDERNPYYSPNELFRYQCQTVTFPLQYVSYSKLGDGIDDCIDGSDELSRQLHWSHFKCDLNDRYECWVFQGDRFNDYRIQNVRLHFHRYCDTMWDMMDGNDEKNCSKWVCHVDSIRCNGTGQCIDREYICDGDFDCDDGEDEIGCRPPRELWSLESICDKKIEYFCITSQYVKNQNTSRPCIFWSQVGDGHIDCMGARDERNVLSCPVDHRMIGDRFLCDKQTKCIDYLLICNGIKDCVDGTDESICYWNISNCLPGAFPCADESGCKSTRCKTSLACYDKSHRFWCPNPNNGNAVYRSQKYRTIFDDKSRCYDQSYSQAKYIIAPRSTGHYIGNRIAESPIYYVYCNKGFYLQGDRRSDFSCFCPPSVYGDRCQYDSRRVTIRIRFDRWHRPDIPIVLDVLFILLLNDSQIVDHHVLTDENKEYPSKNDIYLVYPRPKPPGIYTLRIETYHSADFLHFWEYPISPLDFLPVFRIAKVLRFPDRSLPWYCSYNRCENNGTCYQAEGNRFLCICPRSWKGKFCDIQMNRTGCASNSLARAENVCVCPHGYMQPHCFVQNHKCRRVICRSNETCVPRSDLPAYRHTCICNVTNCKPDRPVIVLNRQEPNELPFLVQLLQLTGNYPTIRHQIIIQPFTSFPWIKTIKTRDKRDYVGSLPEIGLLYSFESYADSVRNTLYLLFINCTNDIRNFTVDLDLQAQKCHEFSTEEQHFVAVFPEFCHNFTYGACFAYDGYLCYCNYSNGNQSNCLSYQRRYITCDYCQNQGHCVQGDLTNKTDFVCVCPKCVTGVLCQFSLSRFSISLEFLFEKNDWNRGHFIAPVILFILGMILNSLSLITFTHKKLRTSGVGVKLQATSLCGLLVVILLLARITYLYMVRKIIMLHRISIVMCKALPMLMYTFYYTTLWLMTTVTVERALATLQSSLWSRLQDFKISISLVLLIIFIVSSSNYIFISQYELVNHPDYIFPWCIREIPLNQQLFTHILTLFHQIIPFLINIIAALIIIVMITRSKMHAYRKTKRSALRDQTRKRLDLLLSPIVCFLAQLPEIIILFLNACDYDTSNWFSQVNLCIYYVSFFPQMSIFFLYITPSKQYHDIFTKETLLGQGITYMLHSSIVLSRQTNT
ncbi:unnamed protein product [Adineta ricciae]|uniref:Uncharacterized protein n=1 Tax=Adineta ricciae TaxID=249248 RepID=A0A815D4N9_ADIRI|nr:unnamed protein product [Adineta ricciae]